MAGQTATVKGAAEPTADATGIAAYDLGSAPSEQVRLPTELHEISGLAVSGDGRVFAHGRHGLRA